MIFSLVKNYKSMLFSLLVLDYFGCLHFCRKDADPASVFFFFFFFFFFNSSNFSVSEQNYKVLVCIFLVSM